jgi:hypothetical protein
MARKTAAERNPMSPLIPAVTTTAANQQVRPVVVLR